MFDHLWRSTCKNSKSLQTSCCFLGKNGERCLQTGVFRQEVAKVPPWPNVECCPPILASDSVIDYPIIHSVGKKMLWMLCSWRKSNLDQNSFPGKAAVETPQPHPPVVSRVGRAVPLAEWICVTILLYKLYPNLWEWTVPPSSFFHHS